MYIPRHFRQNQQEELIKFVNQVGFGMLVQSTDSIPFATHIPVYFTSSIDALQIRTHMALHNPHAMTIKNGGKALLIVQGEHAYISPSAYESVDVPTWDYRIVHCEVEYHLSNAEEAKTDLFDLVRYFEKGNQTPVKPESFPESMMKDYLKYVFPFRLNILKMEGAWKLSQNRTAQEKENIRTQLRQIENPIWKFIE